MSAVFIRLLAEENKGTALEHAVQSVRAGDPNNGLVYRVEPAAFSEIPGSPFAYWASERVRRLFRELPPFESEGRTARVGLQTSDDFRFVRAWWEVPPEKVVAGAPETTPAEFRQQTFEGKKWVPFAKGGAYSPYYADLHLVVNWERDGEEMKAWAGSLYNNSHWSRIINGVDFYFRPGLTWPLRGIRLSTQTVPSGAIFSVAGKLATCPEPSDLPALLGLTNSSLFDFLVCLYAGKVGGVQYEVGLISKMPVPGDIGALREVSRDALRVAQASATSGERNHVFLVPGLAQLDGLRTGAERMVKLRASLQQQLADLMDIGDGIILALYGVTADEFRSPRGRLLSWSEEADSSEPGLDEPLSEEEESKEADPGDARSFAAATLSYSLGCAVGRWDVRLALGEREPPPLPDPFAPLRTCSPGMLAGADGLPAREPPVGYPLTVAGDGILVDDPDHADDIVARVRAVLDLVWGERAAAVEREAGELLGIKELREYFRNPRLFFDEHIKRYSRSKRKAPIYWLLQSSKRSYGLWLYLHRLDADTLFKALERYVGPKLALETQRANDLRAAIASMPQGPTRRQRERDLERHEALVSEIADFKAELERVARLGLAPNLDDGVVLTIAPLHKLVPWKEAEQYWKELMAGKYPWASIAKQLRAKGLVQ